MLEKVLDLLDEMTIEPNEYHLSMIFSACARVKNDRARKIGNKLLHQMPNHYHNDNIVMSTALHMLMCFNDIKGGENIFEFLKKKDIVSYNIMMQGNRLEYISNINRFNLGYVDNNMCEKALDLFEQMPLDPDDVTFIALFKACAQLNNDQARKIGNKLLHQMPHLFHNNSFLMNTVIRMLMCFNDIRGGENIFELIKKKDIVSYNIMIQGNQLEYILSINRFNLGYIDNNMCEKALDLFEQMPLDPDDGSFSAVFKACALLNND
jgi:hypothetical protein